MKQLWKKYDTSVLTAVFCVVFTVATAFFNIWLAVSEALCFAVLISLKLVYTHKMKSKLLHQINSVADELDYERGSAFARLTVACSVIDEDGKIIWFNNSFKDSFEIDKNTSLTNIKELLKRESIEKMLEGRGFRVKVDRRYFAIYSSRIHFDDESVYLLYFFDETKLRLTEKEYYDSRPSIMLSVIDNSEEIYQDFKESDCAAIFSKIEQMIDEWASSYGALCRKFSNARTLIFVEERGLQKMISDKFSILDKVRDFTYEGQSTDITLSIGVGKEGDLNDANNSARQALDMAQSRGGDQVAIKHEAQYKFYGGVSAGFEKKNKVRTRLIAKTIAEIIKDSDNVLVMGHRFSDFDAVGSAVGMYCVAKHFGIDAHMVIDRQTTLAGALVDSLCEKYGKELVISPHNAPGLVHENTLVIVVDTHKQDFTECPTLLDKAGKVMVIDHHRKAVNFIEDTVVFYHMPNSSSASEMVTELVQYVDSKPVIDSIAAQALFAGIMLDTKNFVIRTGVRTFEAAAYLKSRSANTVEVKKLFANDMEIFRMRNAIIDSASKYKEQCAISAADFENKNIRLITSQASDEMLNIEGVKASFVLYKSGNTVNISARSYGEINVQLIMETLGGGGHLAMSACQLPNITIEAALEKLKAAIDKFFDK